MSIYHLLSLSVHKRGTILMPENKVALSSMIKNPMTLALKRLSTLSSFPHRWVNISFWPDKYLRFFVGKL